MNVCIVIRYTFRKGLRPKSSYYNRTFATFYTTQKKIIPTIPCIALTLATFSQLACYCKLASKQCVSVTLQQHVEGYIYIQATFHCESLETCWHCRKTHTNSQTLRKKSGTLEHAQSYTSSEKNSISVLCQRHKFRLRSLIVAGEKKTHAVVVGQFQFTHSCPILMRDKNCNFHLLRL